MLLTAQAFVANSVIINNPEQTERLASCTYNLNDNLWVARPRLKSLYQLKLQMRFYTPEFWGCARLLNQFWRREKFKIYPHELFQKKMNIETVIMEKEK